MRPCEIEYLEAGGLQCVVFGELRYWLQDYYQNSRYLASRVVGMLADGANTTMARTR